MAQTKITIPGVEEITVPFAMTVAQSRDFLQQDYPAINGMTANINADDPENVLISYRSQDGAKG